jgi:putative nucleotidyltransferase with HDIG domain
MDALEKNAKDIVLKLRKAGHGAFYAGGCVRDMVMGHKPVDYDIATSAIPDDVVKMFPRTVEVGAKFGVVLVIQNGHSYEVATFRSENSYTDGRRPDHVEFTTYQEDVVRRDFTINGLLYDPVEEKIIDLVDGVRDIDHEIVRTIGKPEKRFQEDKLRMVRALRFAARFDFEIEKKTFDAVKKLSSKITEVSWERIGEELTKMFTDPNPEVAFDLLHQSGIMKHILPEVEQMAGVEQPEKFHPEGDVLEHTRLALKLLESPDDVTAFAVLFHDIGKPPTFTEADRIRFNNHDVVGAEMTDRVCRRLKFSNEKRKKIVACVAGHMRVMHAKEMRESKLKKLLRVETFPQELELHRVDCLASHGGLEIYEFLKYQSENLPPEVIKPAPLINGRHLIELGFTPGPLFKEILTSVEEMQLENQLSTTEQALDWVKKNYRA